jgi:hypothetical protein
MKRAVGLLGVLGWLLSVQLAYSVSETTKRLPAPPAGVAELVQATAHDLPNGPKADGRPGDYVLRNRIATFVIAGDRPTHGYGRFGGRLVDAVRHENGRQQDFLGEQFFGIADVRGLLAARTLRPTAFEIVSAGGAGKPAILRVQMTDERLPLIDQTTRMPTQPIGVQVTLTYTLEPDSPTLLVEASLQNASDRPQTYTLLLAWVQDDGMQMYMPPFGNAKAAQASGAGADVLAMIQTLRGAIPFAAAVNHTLSYGLFPLEERFPAVQKVQDIYLFTLLAGARAEPNGSVAARWAFTVGAGETETIRAERNRLLNRADELTLTQGVVQNGNGAPLENARVYIFQQRRRGGAVHDGRAHRRAGTLRGAPAAGRLPRNGVRRPPQPAGVPLQCAHQRAAQRQPARTCAPAPARDRRPQPPDANRRCVRATRRAARARPATTVRRRGQLRQLDARSL